MTQYLVTWTAPFGGRKVHNTHAEAQAHAARIRANRGEEAVITELVNGPEGQLQTDLTSPDNPQAAGPKGLQDCQPVVTLTEPGSAAKWFERAETSKPDVEPATLIDEVLAVLAEDDDLRVRTHTARIVQYRRERAAGAVIPRRYRAVLQRPF